MDGLDPLRTPKKGRLGENETSWQKGRGRPPPLLSPVGVRRRVGSKKDGSGDDNDEGLSDVETQKVCWRGKAAHRAGKEVGHILGEEGLAGKRTGEGKETSLPTSGRDAETRRISGQRHKGDDDQSEKLRQSAAGRGRQDVYDTLNKSLRDDISSHQKLNYLETVGAWRAERATPAETEQMLCRFDVIPEYGPCCGLSRKERWRRAEKLGLHPPKEVLEALLVSRKDICIFDQRLAKFGVISPGHG